MGYSEAPLTPFWEKVAGDEANPEGLGGGPTLIRGECPAKPRTGG